MSRKDVELEKLERQLKEWILQARLLESKAARAKAEAKYRYYTQLNELQKKLVVAQKRAKVLQKAGDKVWGDLKKGVTRAWGELRKGIGRARKRVQRIRK